MSTFSSPCVIMMFHPFITNFILLQSRIWVPSLSEAQVNDMTDEFFTIYQGSAEEAFAMTSDLFQSVASVETLQSLLDNSSLIVGIESIELNEFAEVIKQKKIPSPK